MRLAAHADVFVDRHVGNPSNGHLLRERRRTVRMWPRIRFAVPGIRKELEQQMFESVTVIGAGRAGSAIAARLRERGVSVREDGELRLLCVPDRAIAEVARSDRAGPVGRARLGRDAARGARAARAPLLRAPAADARTLARGPEQLDGAWAAVTAESEEARAHALWLAETLGLRPFALRRRRRARSTTQARRRVELPRHALPRRGAAVRRSGRAARGARAADAAHDRERLRADRPDRARRLGDGRAASRGDPRGRAASSSTSTTALAEATTR